MSPAAGSTIWIGAAAGPKPISSTERLLCGHLHPFIKLLAGDLRVIASDARGHGGSNFDGIKPLRSWRVFAEDLKAVVERTSRPPIIGMGTRWGRGHLHGRGSLPRLFNMVVLVDPVFLMPRRLAMIGLMRALGLQRHLPLARIARRRRRTFRSKADALRRLLSGRGIFKAWSPEFVEAYLECGLLEKDSETAVLTCDPELEARIFESIPLNVWGYVKRLRCPVLAIRGRQSDVFLPGAADRLKRMAADAKWPR